MNARRSIGLSLPPRKPHQACQQYHILDAELRSLVSDHLGQFRLALPYTSTKV